MPIVDRGGGSLHPDTAVSEVWRGTATCSQSHSPPPTWTAVLCGQAVFMQGHCKDRCFPRWLPFCRQRSAGLEGCSRHWGTRSHRPAAAGGGSSRLGPADGSWKPFVYGDGRRQAPCCALSMPLDADSHPHRRTLPTAAVRQSAFRRAAVAIPAAPLSPHLATQHCTVRLPAI